MELHPTSVPSARPRPRPRALARRSSLFPLAAVGVLWSASCVSPARYEEALAEARYYQRTLQDLESFHGTCEARIALLEGEMALRDGDPIEAGMTADIDERLAELGRIMEGIGKSPGDVEMLSVEGGYGMRLSDAVLFPSGSATLAEGGRALLLEMASEIRSRPYRRIWVRGHTDSDPIVKPETKKRFPRGNLELSSARAIEVAALLSAEGEIPTNKLVVAGFGSTEPVAANSSAENKRRNRRVEIFVIERDEPGQGGG